jgi:flagellar basal-body rod modification protein FlgD
MDVTSTTATTATTTTTSAMPAVDSDFQMFLTMMTVQLQNQDPLSPMDSDEFAVQLATFSGVEQQIESNDLLLQLLAATTSQSMAQMSSWVGQEARVAAPVYFDGSPVTLSPNPGLDATRAVLVVTDETGAEVDRREMPVSSANYEWDGLDANGLPLPVGVYSLSLESYSGDELLGSTAVEYYAPIQEIRSSPAGVTLLLPGEIEVPSAYVTALRQPDAAI